MISLIISNFNICQIKYDKTNDPNNDAVNANYKHIKLLTTALDFQLLLTQLFTMIVLGFFRLFILFTILIVVVKSRKLIKQVQFEDDIVELIQTSGYQSEVHKVETEDGYILKVHRILVKNEVLKPKSPVFMMHGLGSTASDYVSTGPQHALGDQKF